MGESVPPSHGANPSPPLTRDQFLVRALRFILAKPPGCILNSVQIAMELQAAGISPPEGNFHGIIAMAKSKGILKETGDAVLCADSYKLGKKTGRGHFRPTYKRTNVLDIAFPARFKDIH